MTKEAEPSPATEIVNSTPTVDAGAEKREAHRWQRLRSIVSANFEREQAILANRPHTYDSTKRIGADVGPGYGSCQPPNCHQ